MHTYSFTHFDLFDPALQLESEEQVDDLSTVASAAAQTVESEQANIHHKIISVIAVIERFNCQLSAPKERPRSEQHR
ncbi:hypothetical protein [Pseudomonas sp. M30-35]|uniref:hypothetical protein n=1 Tax=Pseudomonas sp. M30-35 TaxID=1981174 RepID=UPI000B3D4862|nr:hypothetical protein [Pseudomonas sp. M30-35]ARU86966.1 hypothetical protein B9K09_02700 [Pseudomonas sp. M30-35]